MTPICVPYTPISVEEYRTIATDHIGDYGTQHMCHLKKLYHTYTKRYKICTKIIKFYPSAILLTTRSLGKV